MHRQLHVIPQTTPGASTGSETDSLSLLVSFHFLSSQEKKIKLHLWEEVVKGQLLGGLPPTM